MIGFASVKLGLTRERVAFWLAAGSGLVLCDGVYRLDKPERLPGARGPAPTPVLDKVALEAVSSGAALRVEGDLFGRMA